MLGLFKNRADKRLSEKATDVAKALINEVIEMEKRSAVAECISLDLQSDGQRSSNADVNLETILFSIWVITRTVPQILSLYENFAMINKFRKSWHPIMLDYLYSDHIQKRISADRMSIQKRLNGYDDIERQDNAFFLKYKDSKNIGTANIARADFLLKNISVLAASQETLDTVGGRMAELRTAVYTSTSKMFTEVVVQLCKNS